MKPDHDSTGGDAGRFRTTRWTAVLLSVQSQAPGSQEALAQLCRIYWYPIYAFVRHQSKAALSYEQVAAALQVSVGSVKTLIHRLRKQYAALLREEVSRTVCEPGEVDEEIHSLCEALIAAEGRLGP